jgi:hypothetical protein
MKLFTDVDMLFLLMICQNPGHKFGGKKMHVESASKNLLACPITNSGLSKILISSTSIHMNRLLKLGYGVRCCGAGDPTCVLVALSGCPTGPESSIPFKHLCMSHAFFPSSLFNHCQGVCYTYSEMCTKLNAQPLFLCQIHCKIASGQICNSKYKDIKNNKSTQLHESLCTDSQDMVVPSNCATTTAVQMVAPVPKTMDTS